MLSGEYDMVQFREWKKVSLPERPGSIKTPRKRLMLGPDDHIRS
jgi:hypothetical protein